MEEKATHLMFLKLCVWLSRVTQFAGVLTGAMNVCMVFMFSSMPTPELILRCYGVVFGVFIVLVELELPFVLSHAAFLDSWVGRGLCIAFVGLLDVLFDHKPPGPAKMDLLGPAEAAEADSEERFNVWRHAVGWLVITVGCVYTALGLLCFRQLKAVALTKIKRQKLLKEEVNHLTAQKMEIERLLSDTESKLECL